MLPHFSFSLELAAEIRSRIPNLGIVQKYQLVY